MSLSRATQADLVEHCNAAVFSVLPKATLRPEEPLWRFVRAC